jgi:hypothetical protein
MTFANPYRVGDDVVFVPDENTIQRYQRAFARLRIWPGYSGPGVRLTAAVGRGHSSNPPETTRQRRLKRYGRLTSGSTMLAEVRTPSPSVSVFVSSLRTCAKVGTATDFAREVCIQDASEL